MDDSSTKSQESEGDPFFADTLPSSDADSDQGATRRELGNELKGRQLHHFRVDGLIGRGGMGSVYRGHDLSLDRTVALKVVDASLVTEPTLKDRFVREARAQARLNHPNVVQIYYVGEQDDLYFFAMELVEGQSLDDRLVQGKRVSWEAAVEQMVDIASALKLANEQGIIHRDIKPSNLLIDAKGTVKVADFGLAKWVNEEAKITQEGRILGTPLYMSPEQGQGEDTDHRSDMYSLGATFYHLLVGKPPFSSKTPMGIVVKHITQPLPPLKEKESEVSSALALVIEKMMAKDPADRFESYDTLIAALEAVRPHRRTPAGLWVRAIAMGVDIGLMLIALALTGTFFWLLFPWYFILGWWRYGQTVGKWLFRIQVRTLDDSLPSLLGSALRFFVYNIGLWLSLALFGVVRIVTGSWEPNIPDAHPAAIGFGVSLLAIGMIVAVCFGVAGLRKDRRAVHDLASRTRVVYKLDERG